MPYFDHAATSPMTVGVIAAMDTAFRVVGNASAVHSAGRTARRLVEESRETIAAAIGCRPAEVVFTSGGTEADNLAIKGMWHQRRAQDPARTRLLVSAVEHHAVLDSALWLQAAEGAVVETIPVDANGELRLDALRELIEADPASVALVSVMWANNEVGTLQPIAGVVAIANEYGIPVHSDAVQAIGSESVDFAASGLSALTVSAHKSGGPIGIGALVVRREITPIPLLHGGGQERDIRSGTIPMPLIVGMATSFREAVTGLDDHRRALAGLRDALVDGVLSLDLGATLRGHATKRLPGNAHFTFEGCEGDALLMLLDAAGVQVSMGSACSAGVPQASHVLLAMGLDDMTARGAVRFSLGRTSDLADVEAALVALPDAVTRARRAGLMVR